MEDEKVTINDLLKKDDVKEIIAEINKQTGIKDLLVIWSDGTDIKWQANSVTYANILWYLESVKMAILLEEDDA